MMRKTGLILLALGAIVLIISGCSTGNMKKAEWKPTVPVERQPFIHTVEYSGETLRIISKWYTGDVKNWEALSDANPNIDYNNMAIGSKVYIPENLLKTTGPLTDKFIGAYIQKSKPKAKPKAKVKVKKKKKKKKPVIKKVTPPKKDDEFDLIGPK